MVFSFNILLERPFLTGIIVFKGISMIKKQKIMIVGAGINQTPLINKAREMGFETIVISIDGDYPGFLIADKYYKLDIRHKEAILEVARLEKISGIVSDQLDGAVRTVAYVAERLGLPGIGYDCAVKFTDKYMMRQLCKEVGVPVPEHFQVASLDEAIQCAKLLSFPLVIKPVDNYGSLGVFKINNLAEIETKFPNSFSCSHSGKVILEEYFSGKEIVVEGFVSDYQVTNLLIGDRTHFSLVDMFIFKDTLFPSQLSSKMKEKIIDIDSRLIRHLGPKFGITQSEYLIDEKTGELRLVETAIRGGGVFVSSDLVPLACGIDVTEMLLELASGRLGVKIDNCKLVERASGYVCFYLPEGIISEVKGIQEVIAIPGVHHAYLQNITVGKQTMPMTYKGSRLGPILVYAKDRQALQDVIAQVKETLVIRVKTPDGIRGIIW
jgi:biotin carboxylase